MCTNARSSSTVSASSKSFAVSGSIVKASRSRRSTRPEESIEGGSYGSKPRSSPSSTSRPCSTTSIELAGPSTRSTRARPRPFRTTARSPGPPCVRRSSNNGVPGTKYGSPTRCFPRDASSTTTKASLAMPTSGRAGYARASVGNDRSARSNQSTPLLGSDLEETANRQSGAEGAEREAGAEHDQHMQAEGPGMDVGGVREVDQRHEQLTPEHEQDHRQHRSAEAAEQALDHERPAHEPVRRPDELHHLDLPASREDREANRVRDEQRRGDEQHDEGDQHHDPEVAGDREHTVRDAAAALPRAAAGGLRARRRWTDALDPLQVRVAELLRDRVDLLGLVRVDLEGVRERVVGQAVDHRRVLLAFLRERLLLGDELDPLHLRHRCQRLAGVVDLRAGRLAAAAQVGAEVHVDEQLLLVVVAQRERPAAEPDDQTEHEHPDQHRRRRGEGGREVGSERADRLGDHDAEAAHSVVYPPRRSSRRSLPPSSAITRLRILSTISRSWVAIRIVVPERLIR